MPGRLWLLDTVSTNQDPVKLRFVLPLIREVVNESHGVAPDSSLNARGNDVYHQVLFSAFSPQAAGLINQEDGEAWDVLLQAVKMTESGKYLSFTQSDWVVDHTHYTGFHGTQLIALTQVRSGLFPALSKGRRVQICGLLLDLAVSVCQTR